MRSSIKKMIRRTGESDLALMTPKQRDTKPLLGPFDKAGTSKRESLLAETSKGERSP